MPHESLSDFIAYVRKEMVKAMDEGRDDRLRFHVDEVELEVQVVATEEGGENGGLDLKIVKWGVEESESLGRTHTVRLKLRSETLGERGSEPTELSR